MQWLNKTGVHGDEIILQKLDMVRSWLKDNWNINIDDIRREVQRRQYMTNPDGSFMFDNRGRLINKLTQPSDEDPSITTMEYLVKWVTNYKSLQ